MQAHKDSHGSSEEPLPSEKVQVVDHVEGDEQLMPENGAEHPSGIRLFFALVAMCALWVGSQIPLYLFGTVLPLIYSDLGGYDRYVWAVIGYLIPCACLCPFVGALTDVFGRRNVGAAGQILLIIGPIVTSTAHSMNIVIAGQAISGFGAGLNELTALAATAELVPVKRRGLYIGLVVLSIVPFCPSAVYAPLIAEASSWRYVGILVAVWNFVGLILLLAAYKDPKKTKTTSAKATLRQVDFVGGFLSTSGVLCFMMGLQWGAKQYAWGSVHVLVPFILGIILLIAFFVWEARFAPYPMAPKQLFSRSKRTMILLLIIIFLSGASFFAMLLFWPVEVYNVYSDQPVHAGIRTLSDTFGIIGGAALGLILISVSGGRTTILMIISTAIMTAFTGAMSIANPNNISTMYGIACLAGVGVGLVIIPSSIICQIFAPPELVGTITAITLSIRYIGGAIGYTVYANILQHKLLIYATNIAGPAIYEEGISYSTTTIEELIVLAVESNAAALKELIATSPLVFKKDIAYEVVEAATEQAFAMAYRWPYWISVAFGAVCFLASFGLKDVRKFMGYYES